MDVEKLYVAECFVTPGAQGMKRVMPRARGSAFRIVKRTSHVALC
ncbi:MAG: large ribosomal subunit protein uL22 [Acutalibacteraceae bacterium]